MAGKPVGTMFAEIGLDASKLEQGLKKTQEALISGTIKVEDAYKVLGVKSERVFDTMRDNAIRAQKEILEKTILSENEIRRVKEQTAKVLKSIDEQQFGKQSSLLDKMKTNWIAGAAAVTAAWMAVGKAMEWAELGAKAEQAAESFRLVSRSSGANADKLLADMKRVSAGTIDQSDLMQKAVSGMAKGLSGDQIVKIMEAARVSARVSGEDVKTAFEAITDSIANQMPRALKKYGLITMEQQKIVSAALAAGVQDVNLYSIAMANATIQAARMGELSGNSAEGIQRFKAAIHDLKETIGEFLIVFGQKLLATMKVFAGMLTYMIAPIAYLIDGTEGWNAALEAGNNLLVEGRQLLGDSSEEQKKASAESTASAQAQVAASKKVLEMEQARLKAATEGKKAEEEIKKAIIETAAIGKSAYQNEMERIKEKAAEMKKAGVHAVTIENWVAAHTALAAKKSEIAWKDALEGMSGGDLVGLDRTLDEIEKKYKKLAETFAGTPAADPAAMAAAKAAERSRAEIEWSTKTTAAIRQNEEQLFKDREAATKEYEKIVTEANDWSISEHQKAINKILSSEVTLVGRLYELWDGYKITYKELTEGLAAIRAASAGAIEAQEQKQLKDRFAFEAKLSGTGEAARLLKFQQIDEESARYKKMYADTLASAEERAKKEVEINKWAKGEKIKYDATVARSQAQEAAAGFRDVAGAAKQLSEMYAEGSKQRKILHGISMAASIAEKVALLAEATSAAVVAIATQGKGDPYTAFARIATMIAIMSSLLAQIGGSVSGGGGGAAAPPVLPPSTVLGGAPGTPSESISNIMDMLDKTYDLQSKELTRIRSEMVDLNRNITGLATTIVRGGQFDMSANRFSMSDAPGAVRGAWDSGIAGLFNWGALTIPWVNQIGDAILDKLGFGSKTFTPVSGGIGFGMEGWGAMDSAVLRNVSQSVKDFLEGISVAAVKYTDIMVTGSKGDTWMNSIVDALDQDAIRLITQVYSSLSKSLVSMGKAFGADMERVKRYVYESFKLDLSKYKTGDEINKALSDYFSGVGDTAVKTLFGEMIAKYQKINEGMYETAVRLLRDITVVDKLLEMTNQQLSASDTVAYLARFGEEMMDVQEALRRGLVTPEELANMRTRAIVTETANEKLMAMTEHLVDLAGGLDEFVNLTSNYFSQFMSEAEQMQFVKTNLAESMRDLGYSIPSTREGFKSLISTLDLADAAQRETYISLLRLADSADALYDAHERLVGQYQNLQDRLLSLQGDSGAILARTRERELGAADPSLHPILRAIHAQEDYNAAVENVTRTTNEYNTAVQNTASARDRVTAADARLVNAHNAAADAAREHANAEADLPRVMASAARSVSDAVQASADANESLRRAQEDYPGRMAEIARSVESAYQRAADAAEAVTAAHQGLADAERDAAQQVANAQRAAADAADGLARTMESAAKSIASAERSYQQSLRGIADAQRGVVNAQRAYSDAVQALADEYRAIERRGIEARLRAESDARAAEIKQLEGQKKLADEQARVAAEQLSAQETLVGNLRSVSESINSWIAEMSTSALAPALSRTAYESEYQRLRGAASAPGAEQSTVSDFLSFSKQYLEFQRAYGGDYQATYDQVMADVMSIGAGIDSQLQVAQQQLTATVAADEAARLAAERAQAALEAAQTANDAANVAAQELLAAFDAASDDTARRLADLRQGIADAAQGILDAEQSLADAMQASADAHAAIAEAQLDAARNISDAQTRIADAEASIGQAQLDAARNISDAQTRIADAQVAANQAQAEIGQAQIQAQRDIVDATRNLADLERNAADAEAAIGQAQLVAAEQVAAANQRIADAQVAIGVTATEIRNAELEQAAAILALQNAIAAEAAALLRMEAAQLAEVAAMAALTAAMIAFAAAIPPTVIVVPPPPIPPGTEPPPITILPGRGYEPPPELPPGYVPTIRFIPEAPVGAVGGLYNSPTIGGEAGPEWFVPTYEPERSRFIQSAPKSFWDNLGARGGGGEITITVPVTIDGRVLTEVVAKHIPRNATIAEAIRRV